jgi:hypothetical protein
MPWRHWPERSTAVAFVTPTAEQLGLYLGLDEIQGDRADLLILQAVALAESVVTPLPDQAKADKAALKSLAGRGGAFTVDPTPETASPWASWPLDGDPLLVDEFEPGWGYP